MTEVESSKVKVIKSQVKTESVSKRGAQLVELVELVAPSGEYVYKYRRKVPKITLICCANT